VTILTINIFCSNASVDLGLAKSSAQVAELRQSLKGEVQEVSPLDIWTKQIEELSLIRKNELAELYSSLISSLDAK
jgi:hypothetical protein